MTAKDTQKTLFPKTNKTKLIPELLSLECTSTYFLLTNQVFGLVAVHAVAQGKGPRNFFCHLIHELQMSWILSPLVENNSKEEKLCLPSLSLPWTLWMITWALSMRNTKDTFKLRGTPAVHYGIWFHMVVYSLSKHFFFQRVKELSAVHVCQNEDSSWVLKKNNIKSIFSEIISLVCYKKNNIIFIFTFFSICHVCACS